MISIHPSRVLTAIVVIFSMLFMQLAVASYVCPGMPTGSQSHATLASTVMADMPDCDGMDLTQPTLCHTFSHGEQNKQSVDKSSSPDVQPFVPVLLLSDLGVFDVAAVPNTTPPSPIALTRITAPPIAIRHCCFRI